MTKFPTPSRFVALGLLVILAACSSGSMIPASSDRLLLPKIALDVQAITLADRSGMQSSHSLYTTNHFSPTITDSIKQWAGDRLQAVGQTGQAIVIIKDASLTSQVLPTKSGVDYLLTRQQGLKYTAHAEVSVEATGKEGGHEGFAVSSAVATRSVTLPEDPTPIEKQDAYYALITGLMKDLGQNLETAIQGHLSRFVVRAPIYGATATPLSIKNAVDSAPVIMTPSQTVPSSVAPDATSSSNFNRQ